MTEFMVSTYIAGATEEKQQSVKQRCSTTQPERSILYITRTTPAQTHLKTTSHPKKQLMQYCRVCCQIQLGQFRRRLKPPPLRCQKDQRVIINTFYHKPKMATVQPLYDLNHSPCSLQSGQPGSRWWESQPTEATSAKKGLAPRWSVLVKKRHLRPKQLSRHLLDNLMTL